MKKREWRYPFIMIVLGLAGAAVLGRYFWLAAKPGKESAAAVVATGERGLILDRNGRILAVDTPLYDLSVWRPDTDAATFVTDAKDLAAISGTPEATIISRWKNGAADFFYIGKRLSPQAQRAVAEGKAAGRFKGIKIDEVAGRLYPEGHLAAQLIGFTGEANKGLEGIEIKYDAELSPPAAGEADRSGNPVNAGGEYPRGNNIVLTIDANLQYLFEEQARASLIANKAEAVMMVAMDVKTGELLAYVSMPDYDPNDYGSFSVQQRQDRLSVYSYEPGSVFKVYSMASILDLGAITPYTTFTCTGAYTKVSPKGEKFTIRCLAPHGKVDLGGILANSCNVGVSYASERISDMDLYEKLKSFGFGSRTGVGLAGESPGAIRDPEDWSGRTKPTIAIGQESLVTALQMTQAAGAIANGGVLMKPQTVKRIERADGSLVYENTPQAVRSVVSPESARRILTAMESVASLEGTGWRAKVPDVRMAVKTGTAQMIDTATRAYSDTDFIASTVGILPADDPRVAIYIAVVKPRAGEILGGRIAAPMVREAAEAALATLDIPRGKTPTVTHSGSVSLPELDQVVIGGIMPDLKKTPKRLLLSLLSRTDIKVLVRGDGYVVRQSPEAGSPVEPGMTIVLDLE
ncbi:MAG: penicillin-binding protein [Rectinemataceae bacterium]